MIDMPMHAQRRKLWDKAMNGKALDGYMEPLARRVSQMISLIDTQGKNGGTVDFAACMSYFSYVLVPYHKSTLSFIILASFDFMGDLG